LASHLRLLIDFLHSFHSFPSFDRNLQFQYSLAPEIKCPVVFILQLIEAKGDNPSKFFSFKSIAQKNL
jgi:hypothetical protein